MSEIETHESVVNARGLSLRYGRTPVLSNVDLAVGPGEFWFLLGPNGSGKSTFLKALLGTLRPAAGSVAIDPAIGFERTGYVPQRCDLNPSLSTTVREFVSTGFVGTRLGRGERGERLRWALDRVGLADRIEADYWSLSGGQRQRALVARALLRSPRLLILDEPTEGLDVEAEQQLLETLAELNRSDGTTLLLVTHHLRLASIYATHLALFIAGGVIAGPSQEVLERRQAEQPS